MSGAREVRTKISSIKNTRKITSAMEKVAASKMRKTQERMRASRPYADKIYSVIQHIARSNSEYRHPYLQEREVKQIGLIVVSTDRGLCGGLNSNLFREVSRFIQSQHQNQIGTAFGLFGRKAEAFFKRYGGKILATKTHLGDVPKISNLVGLVKTMLEAYDRGEIDAIYIAYNRFITTMNQKPTIQQLLPLPKSTETEIAHRWDYIYEPDAKVLLDQLFTRYIELLNYQAIVDNIACEQAAKMIAMKSATDNAGDLIKDLQMIYNKARQAAITQELAEIVGGAAAL